MPRPKMPRDEKGNIIREDVAVVTTPEVVVQDGFRLSLKVNGETITETAPTIFLALKKVKHLYPIKTRAFLNIKYGKKETEEMLTIPRLTRLLANDLTKELYQKRVNPILL